MQNKSSPINTGLVSWDLFEPKGGLGRALTEIVSTLQRKGLPVKTMSPDTIDNQSHTQKSPMFFRKSPILYSLYLLCTLQKWIDSHDIEKVLLPTGPGGLFLLRKPKNCQVICISYHTYAQQSTAVPTQWWKRIFVPFEKRTLHLADSTLCYSADTKQILLSTYTLEEVSLLPQIIDLKNWSTSTQQKKKFQCVCVARLEKRKGVDVLLQAWIDVQQAIPDAHLILIGDGILQKTIDTAIVTNNLSIQRTHSLSQDQLQIVLKESSVAICPSYLEGFGLAAVEAMAAGTTVVASDVDGLRSLVGNNDTGFLVPAGDSSLLAQAIIKALQNEKMQQSVANNAKKEVLDRFDHTKASQKLIDALQKVTSRRTTEKTVLYT